MLASLKADDIAVTDRYYCSFMMIALLLGQGTHVCARKHQYRHSDFRRGRRLGKYDHLLVWTRPERPEWMDKATYDQIPETLELRENRQLVQRLVHGHDVSAVRRVTPSRGGVRRRDATSSDAVRK